MKTLQEQLDYAHLQFDVYLQALEWKSINYALLALCGPDVADNTVAQADIWLAIINSLTKLVEQEYLGLQEIADLKKKRAHRCHFKALPADNGGWSGERSTERFCGRCGRVQIRPHAGGKWVDEKSTRGYITSI